MGRQGEVVDMGDELPGSERLTELPVHIDFRGGIGNVLEEGASMPAALQPDIPQKGIQPIERGVLV